MKWNYDLMRSSYVSKQMFLFQLFLSPWIQDLVVNYGLIYVKCEITELSSYFILDLKIRLTNLHTKSVLYNTHLQRTRLVCVPMFF